MIKKAFQTNVKFGAAIVFLSLIIFMLLELKNNRFVLVDFEVYYKAAERLLQGENLYRDSDAHFRYKYSPVAAVYFIPFSIIPLYLSKFIFWIFSAFVIAALHFLSLKIVFPYTENEKIQKLNKIVLLAGLCLSVHFMMDIHLGQVNSMIFLLYALAILFYKKQKYSAFSLMIALSLFLKPFGLIFIPYLVVKRKFKQTAMLLGYSLVLALLPVLFFGVSECIHQYSLWFNELSVEISRKQDILAGGNHTIFSILARYTPLRLIEFTPMTTKILQAAVLLLIGIVVLWFINKGRSKESASSADFGLLICIIPLLSFTDTNSFGALFLIIYFLLANFNRMKKVEKTLTVTGLFLTSANIYDIWGVKLFTLFKELSILSIGTILLIVILALLRKKETL